MSISTLHHEQRGTSGDDATSKTNDFLEKKEGKKRKCTKVKGGQQYPCRNRHHKGRCNVSLPSLMKTLESSTTFSIRSFLLPEKKV
mmetsp:Transcript_16642/g.24285  ORF Transcript_16642/g.24285 Transcript_16642/m.24285 type:complete len:86 (+) Transcript_16642:1499-1756(+)